MASTKKLFDLEYHDDDDTGMYHVGEVDFGISGTLNDFLRTFGRAGKDDLIKTMAYLMYDIECRYRQQNPSPSPGESQASAS